MYEETFFAQPPGWMLILTGALPLATWLAMRALRMRRLVLAWLAVGLTVTVPAVLPAVDQRAYERLLYENGPVELWTAFLLLFAGGEALRRARRERSAALRSALAALGAVFVVGACEELSWGQNLFQWASPDLFLRWNEQRETNLHNITGRVIDTKAVTILVLLAVGVAGPLLARRLGRAGVRLPAAAGLLPQVELAPLFLPACALCLDLPTGLEAELGELVGAELLAIAVAPATPARAALALPVPQPALEPGRRSP